jgi:tetratricopeptide (TPR) repeat protein
MGCSRVTASQSEISRIAAGALVVIALLVALKLHGQSQQQAADSATLQGTVRDSQGHPLAAATVFAGGTSARSAHTDPDGRYRFAALPPGSYTLRAEMHGYREASVGPFVLEPKEPKSIDLTLADKSSPPQSSAAPKFSSPEFFDEPNFTVAGVTDPTTLGGHGSDVVVRNKEALAKETVSLGRKSPGSSGPESSVSSAEKSLREIAAREPKNFNANYNLGELLVAHGKAREAFPYLERASQLNPGDFENTYELALACAGVGDYEHAGRKVRTLFARKDRSPQDQAKLHHLLGDVEEQLGSPLEAVREYQRAAELDPSEPNLFDWGAELLMHRAPNPAIEVFTKGNRLFPHSVRMLVGLGVSWYARGFYEQAVQRLCDASDLNPDDPNPYLFLGKIQSGEKTQPDALVERLRRFAMLQPENALANYYYAVSLWKSRKGPENMRTLSQVQSLLEKSVHLDPKLGVGYLQLGILYSERRDFSRAISVYQQTIAVSPQLEEPHYRLAEVYKQTGQKLKAQEELEVYNQISKRKAADIERNRHEIQQFVYTLRDRTPAQHPE